MTIQLDVVSRRLSHSNARFLLILIPVVIFIGVYSFYSDHSGTPTTVEKVMGEPMKENLPPLKAFKTKDLLPLNDSNKPKSKEQLKLQLTSAEMASNIGRKEEDKEEAKVKEDVDVEKENTEDAHDKDSETESSNDKEIHKSKEQSEKQDELREDGDDKEEFHPKDISTSLKKGKSTEEKKTTEEKEIMKDNDKDEEIEKNDEDVKSAKTDAAEEHTENIDNTSISNRKSKEIIMKKEEEPTLPKSSEKKNIDEITVDKVVDNAKEHMEEKIEKGKSKEEITVERIDLNKKYYDKSSGKLKSRETGKTNSKEEETPEETEKPDDDSLVA